MQRAGLGRNLVDLAIAVFLLCILALFCTNILIIQIAKSYNDLACRRVTFAAARAALDGQDQRGIVTAAQGALSLCGAGGFFIHAPQLVIFTHDLAVGKHKICVRTETIAKVPAPILIPGRQIDHCLSQTYTIEFAKAKNTNKI